MIAAGSLFILTPMHVQPRLLVLFLNLAAQLALRQNATGSTVPRPIGGGLPSWEHSFAGSPKFLEGWGEGLATADLDAMKD
jgi:hypothetical protein